MVLMEIINLEDSHDNVFSEVSGSSPLSSPVICGETVSQRSRKRKRNRNKKGRKCSSLSNLERQIKNNQMNVQTDDPDATLNPDEISVMCQRSNKKKKRRKKNSVVVIDSDEDCTKMDDGPGKENNSVDSDEVLCLSDSSVIELSDSEEIGTASGCVETSRDRPSSTRLGEKSLFGDSVQSRKRGTRMHVDMCNNYQDNSSAIILELRQKVQRKKARRTPPKRKHIAHLGGTSSGTVTQCRENSKKITTQPSRQSISYQPLESAALIREGLRPIAIDGSNVAFGHGKERFSAKGLEICIDYFLRRNHTEVHAFVPQFRRRHPSTVGFQILDKLEKDGHLVYTPSRQVDGKRITSYDDRYVVEYATKKGAIVVTRDNYQDLLSENKSWSDTINFRLLQYTFVGDMIMFPQDPLGRGGPTLDKFLKF